MNHLTRILHYATFTCAITLLLLNTGKSQSVELRGQLNSGFFSYRGAGAKSTSLLNNAEFTNDPYGRKGAVSYGASLNLKRVTKSHFIFGVDLGYEMLRSKVNLKFDDPLGGDILWQFNGRTFLNNQFINLYPFIGTRFKIDGQPVDITLGSDVGFLLNSKEKGKAVSNDGNINLKTSKERHTNLKADIRPRLQVSTDFERIGIYIGYAYGLSNYYKGYIGGKNNEAYSRMFRLGLSYRIK